MLVCLWSCFLFGTVSVSAHSHPHVWKSCILYVIWFCQQYWLGEPCPEGWIWERRRSCSGAYPSPCLSSPAPLFPSLAFFPLFFKIPFLLPPLPRPQGVLRRCRVPKWDDFSPSSSLVALSISQINIEKTLNLTAEWLIQIIVAFSCIRLLFSLTLFLLFFLSPSTVWYLGHLWIRAFEWKGRKNKWHQRAREREGSKTWVAL